MKTNYKGLRRELLSGGVSLRAVARYMKSELGYTINPNLIGIILDKEKMGKIEKTILKVSGLESIEDYKESLKLAQLGDNEGNFVSRQVICDRLKADHKLSIPKDTLSSLMKEDFDIFIEDCCRKVLAQNKRKG